MFLNSAICPSCGIYEFCKQRNNGCSGWRSKHQQAEIERVIKQKPFKVTIIKEAFNSGIALWQNEFIGKEIEVKDCAGNPDIFVPVKAGISGIGYAISKTDCSEPINPC